MHTLHINQKHINQTIMKAKKIAKKTTEKAVKKTAKKAAAKKTAKKTTNKVAKKAAKKITKKTTKRATKKTAKKVTRKKAPSIEEIQLTAYSIYLNRLAKGTPGNEIDDWEAAVKSFK